MSRSRRYPWRIRWPPTGVAPRGPSSSGSGGRFGGGAAGVGSEGADSDGYGGGGDSDGDRTGSKDWGGGGRISPSRLDGDWDRVGAGLTEGGGLDGLAPSSSLFRPFTGGGVLRGALLAIVSLALIGNVVLVALGSGEKRGGVGGAAVSVVHRARGVFTDALAASGWTTVDDEQEPGEEEVSRARPGGGYQPSAGGGSDGGAKTTSTERTSATDVAGVASGIDTPDAGGSGDADLAIFIQVAALTLPLLPRLLWALDHPRSLLLVHFDAKMDDDEVADSIATIRAMTGRTAQLQFMERELVTYRGVSMVLNTLSAIHAALQSGRIPWTHFLNISAADYPLVSPEGMRRALGRSALAATGSNGAAASPAINDTLSASMRSNAGPHGGGNRALAAAAAAAPVGATPTGERADRPNYLQLGAPSFTAATRRWRFEHIYTDTSLGVAPPAPSEHLRTGPVADSLGHRLIGTGQLQPLYDEPDLPFAAAEAWMILTRDAAEFIAHSARARRLLLAFAGAAEPEEHYFASLLLGEPRFASTIVPHALREVVWAHRGVRSGQHPFILDSVANWTAGVAAGGAPSSVSEDVAAAAAAIDATPALPLSRVGTPPTDGSVDHYVFRNRLLKSTALFARKFAVPDSPLMAFLDAHKSGITIPPPAPSAGRGEPPPPPPPPSASLALSRVTTSGERLDTTLRCLRSLVPDADPWTSCLVNETFLRRLPPVPGLPPGEFWLR